MTRVIGERSRLVTVNGAFVYATSVHLDCVHSSVTDMMTSGFIVFICGTLFVAL